MILNRSDLERWTGPEGARHPRGRHADSLGVVYVFPRPEVRNDTGRKVLRPAVAGHVRLTGPLTGVVIADPNRLRYEAARLLDAADTLDAILAPPPPITGTLFDPEVVAP